MVAARLDRCSRHRSLRWQSDGTALRPAPLEKPVDGDVLELLSSSDGRVLAVEHEWVSPSLARMLPPRFAPLMGVGGHRSAALWTITDDAPAKAWLTSQLEITCLHAGANDDGVLCSAFDGVTTRVFAVDPRHERWSAIAAIDRRLYPRATTDDGSLFGWAGGASVLIEKSTGSMVQLKAEGGIFANAVAMAGGHMAVASSRGNGAIIRFYNR